MTARAAHATRPAQKAQRELEDLQLALKARNGDGVAMDQLIRRYTGFVRLKASSYFLAGGDSEDLIQEGLIGLYKAVRDYRTDKETSFRSFAELCVTRQIITAIKTATRFKHAPLNTYVSFSHTPAGQESDGDCTLGDALPGPAVNEPFDSRVGFAPPLPRGLVLRTDGRGARLRHEDDRQRPAAGQAEDPPAPGHTPGPAVA
jgi:RNA polymerase sigma factor (sigma-70 family)